jgi:hypothetical protein
LKRKSAVQIAILAAVTISIVLKVIWTLPYQTEESWQGYQVALVADTAETTEAHDTSPAPIAKGSRPYSKLGFTKFSLTKIRRCLFFNIPA